MAGHLAGFAAHSQGSPRHPAQGREEGGDRAPPACWVDGALASQLQKCHDGMHPVCRCVRIRAVVEGRPRPGHHWSGKRASTTGQPGGTSNDWLLSAMEPGLRAATAQLENRQRRFGLRLLSLPQGDQAREIVGAPTAIGRRFTNSLAYAGGTERIVLLEELETLDAELLQEEDDVKAEAERSRPGLTMFANWSRLNSGAVGYSVVWRKASRPIWVTTRRPTMQSALPSPARWNLPRKET